MELGDKETFVKDYVKGYIDGHDLESMEESQMHDKVIQVEGYAAAQYDMILMQIEGNKDDYEE
jgi:hypothetical protein